MSLIVQQTKEYIAENFPAVHSWFPGKEQRAGETTGRTIVDYARGMDLVGTADQNTGLADAIRVAGAAGAGSDWQDAGGVGTDFLVDADEHFLALCVAVNLSDANSYLYYGRKTGAATIRFTEAGVPGVSVNGVTSNDTISATTGSVAWLIGINRTTGNYEFGHVTSAGADGGIRTLSAGANAAAALNFGASPTANGVSLYGGASGALPCGLYNMVIAKFKGNFPVWADILAEMVQWRADSIVGKKYIPPFMRNLTI